MKFALKLFSITMALFCLSIFNPAVFAQGSLTANFKETKLKNGLRVITLEDRSAPVVALTITYDVGSRNERQGLTGFAHLFEHMMFQGSANVGKAEHFSLIQNSGGILNGTTNTDRTNYFQAVPSNQLEMILFLEADRMRSLEITKEKLDNQRNAVQEERRLRIDNEAYGKSEETLEELMYDNFAYKHSIIGSMEDLNAASVEDVASFFKTYYAPNNAVLTLVGDFNTADALRSIKKHFEAIPNQPAPPPVDMTEPKQTAERRVVLEDALAQLARVDIAFKAVPGNTPDFYALKVLFASLNGGQSSRLFQKLVREKQLVTSITGKMDERRGTGAFFLTATVRPGKTPAEVEAAIYEEIESLKKTPIADWELRKAKNNIRRAFITGATPDLTGLNNALLRSITLGLYTVFYNDPNLINTRLDRVNAVKIEDVQRVAQQFLNAANRTVVVTTPKAKTTKTAISTTQQGTREEVR